MKNIFLLTAVAAVFALTGCDKNNDEKVVDIAHIIGQWNKWNDDPRLEVDGTVTYTFETAGAGKFVVYDVLSDTELAHPFTWRISTNDSKILTIALNDGTSEKQYFVTKLTAKEMKWKEVVYGGEPSVIALRK